MHALRRAERWVATEAFEAPDWNRWVANAMAMMADGGNAAPWDAQNAM